MTQAPSQPRNPFWSLPVEAVLDRSGSSPEGLSEAEAALRLERDGPNAFAPPRQHLGIRLFLRQFENPILLVLMGATAVSMALGQILDGAIIIAIVAASAVLGFAQERNAGRAVQALVKRVALNVEVLRDGRELSVPLEEVVVGDVLSLRAGDVVAADARMIASRELLVDEASLTGESYPRHKHPEPVDADAAPGERTCALFHGTHVVSGAGTAVVVATGAETEFAGIAREIASEEVTTGFERGIADFGRMLVRVMVVLVVGIFVVNVALQRPLVDALLFSLALAVGLTPQLLPAIVSVSLAAGARKMAARDVIVKRLDAIEDLGGMTVLCTDKTGTLTQGSVELESAIDVSGEADPRVGYLAALNAGLQAGFPNPLDRAICARSEPADHSLLLAEIPYDFERRRLSVLVDEPGGPLLITKGAVREVLDACTRAVVGGREMPIGDARETADRLTAELGGDGLRVLALATRSITGRTLSGADEERDLVLRGFLTFRDPPKEGAMEAIASLAARGCRLRIVTGDAVGVAVSVARRAGLSGDPLTGAEMDELDDAELSRRISTTQIFAEVGPLQKGRIVRALQAQGEVVGFLGDGINDVVALHAADIGISVDSAVDVAKGAASVVLLDKSLAAVEQGVVLGRQTFANTLKYVRVTISANFGNMLSLAAASAFLPFLPMLPRQILLLNFLSDIPALAIASDSVDPEQLERPSAWSIPEIRRFMLAFGVLSTVFDLAAFATMRLGFGADAQTFRSGWFVESTLTELIAMLVLRTGRVAFRSRPGRGLLVSSIAVAAIVVALPFSPLRIAFAFVGLSPALLLALLALTGVYLLANELFKRLFRVWG